MSEGTMIRRKKKLIIILIAVIIIALIATIIGIILLKNNKEPEKSAINIEKTADEEFNKEFLEYEGIDISIENVLELANKIIQSNANNEQHQISVKIISHNVDEETEDPATLITILNTLNPEYNFSVYFEYDSEKYINFVTINQNINMTREQKEASEFNKRFLQYEGQNISAILVKSLLTAVLENNNTNEENQITVELTNTNLQAEIIENSQLAEIQNSISESNRYKTEFEFSDNGYISKVSISIIENEEQNNIEQYQDKIITGKELKEKLINNMLIYNSQNPEHKSSIYSEGLNSITEIEEEASYKIIISYDEEGYPIRVDAVRQ